MVQTDYILNPIIDIPHSVSVIRVTILFEFMFKFIKKSKITERCKKTVNNLLFFNLIFRIVFLKRLVAWFFQRKINRNANQLKTLRAEKKKIIEQVMDKETYKVACEILNRFGDASTRAQHQPVVSVSGKCRHLFVFHLF